ncbi:MAG: class I SAM-dependent methyltransferase [Halieaceae bacterium]|nr:class I SAM-dependent methyltransferase [Halieaceae bacterium]
MRRAVGFLPWPPALKLGPFRLYANLRCPHLWRACAISKVVSKCRSAAATGGYIAGLDGVHSIHIVDKSDPQVRQPRSYIEYLTSFLAAPRCTTYLFIAPNRLGGLTVPDLAALFAGFRVAVRLLALTVFGLLLAGAAFLVTTPDDTQEADSPYTAIAPTRDGTGRVYMDREIAQVMGHLGAGWLERSTREQEERTDLLLKMLELDPADTVLDLGAGTGYFSFPMAQQVPQGEVIALDIQPEMLAIIDKRKASDGVTNVIPTLGEPCDPGLAAATVDVVLMVDAYHEFSCPLEVMRSVVTALKPEGRIVLVEYRADDPSVPIKPLHTMTVEQATREMEAVGLVLQRVDNRLPMQHVMEFVRPD